MRVAFFAVLFIVLFQIAASAATLTTDKTLYKQGETIYVSFTDPEAHPNAWIGMFYESAPSDPWSDGDAYDLAYSWTNGAASGVLQFTANQTGFLQFRFYNEDSDINVASTVSPAFEVSTEGGRIGGPTLSFEKPVFLRGEHVKLHYTWDPSLPQGAWIGMFRNGTPLDGTEDPDSYDIMYQWLGEDTSGVWVLDAPEEIGWYRAAIVRADSETDWNPYCTISMQVTLDGKHALPVADDRNPIVLSASKLHVGDELTIAYAAGLGLRDSAWVGIMPASVTSGKESDNDAEDINYIYVTPGDTWYWTFYVPDTPGMYVVRLFPSNDSNCYAVNDGTYFEVIPR